MSRSSRLQAVTASALAALLLLLPQPTHAAGDDPALAVTGATAADGLAVSTTTAGFSRPIEIVNGTNKPVQVVVQLPDLLGPDSRAVKTTWDLDRVSAPSAATTVKPLGAATLTVAANLSASGLDRSTLSLIYGQKRYQVAVAITRTIQVAQVFRDEVIPQHWGFRHVIELPPQQTKPGKPSSSEPAPGIRTQIPVNGAVTMVPGVNAGFKSEIKHSRR